jgi:hypothetical protein
MNTSDSSQPSCLSSFVPFEPNRCGVRGYLLKSSRLPAQTHLIDSTIQRFNDSTFYGAVFVLG